MERDWDIHSKDIYSNTPLHVAAEGGYIDFVCICAPRDQMLTPKTNPPLGLHCTLQSQQVPSAVEFLASTNANII